MLPSLERIYERKFGLMQHIPGLTISDIDNMEVYQILWMENRTRKMIREITEKQSNSKGVEFRRSFNG